MVTARAINSNHFYYLALTNGNQLRLVRRDGDSKVALASRSFTVSAGTFYTLRITAQGPSLTAFVNGTQQLTASDSSTTLIPIRVRTRTDLPPSSLLGQVTSSVVVLPTTTLTTAGIFTNTDTGAIGPVLIENCISYNNGFLTTGGTTTDSDGNGFKLGGNDIPVNHTIRRSIAFGNKKHGITFNSNPGSITVTNNTSMNNGQANLKFDQGLHVFTNNLSFNGGDGDDRIGTDVSNTNCWWINNVSVNGKGLVVSAADFVSLTLTVSRNADGSINLGNFLRLAPGSDLINAGTPRGTDIGAIESP